MTDEVPLALVAGELDIIINALAEVSKDPDHDEHENLKTLVQVPIGKPIKIEGGATEAAMATLTAFGLPAGNEVNVRLLRFGKSAVLQKIFVMLYPYASDPRLLYMLAYCEEDPNCKPDEDGAINIDLFKITDKSVEALWEMCSTVGLVEASVSGKLPDMPKAGSNPSAGIKPTGEDIYETYEAEQAAKAAKEEAEKAAAAAPCEDAACDHKH